MRLDARSTHRKSGTPAVPCMYSCSFWIPKGDGVLGGSAAFFEGTAGQPPVPSSSLSKAPTHKSKICCLSWATCANVSSIPPASAGAPEARLPSNPSNMQVVQASVVLSAWVLSALKQDALRFSTASTILSFTQLALTTFFYTMRAELIGHFKACMTEIYIHIDARMADYIRTHP